MAMTAIVFHPDHAGDQDDPTKQLDTFLGCCREGSTDGWTCKKTAQRGDLYLFWFGKPAVKKIAGVGICKGDVDPTNVERHWMCSFDPLKALTRPITGDQIKGDRELAKWWKGKPYRGGPKNIPEQFAASLLTLI